MKYNCEAVIIKIIQQLLDGLEMNFSNVIAQTPQEVDEYESIY